MGRFTKLLKESNNKTNLATHPLFNADESKKKDYFQALVFVCVEDENFSDDEKEYLQISLVAMGLNESLFDEFEKFTQEPDEDELLALVDRLKEFNKDEKFSFLVDVCVVAFKDGDFDKSEMELFDEYLEILDMRESRQIILYLANIINIKDIDGAISFYTAQKEVFKKFSYMFELLGIDVEKEMKKIFVYEWVISKMHQGNIRDNNRVALNPISTREFCIFLNSLLMDNTLVQAPDTTRFITTVSATAEEEVEVYREVQANFDTAAEERAAHEHKLDEPFNHNGIVYVMRDVKRIGGMTAKTIMTCSDQTPLQKKQGIILHNIEDTNLEYNEGRKLFFYVDEIKHEPITGSNDVGASYYIWWVKQHSNENVNYVTLNNTILILMETTETAE